MSTVTSRLPLLIKKRALRKPEVSIPLMAFTYFYSSTFYILLLSFYFWLWRLKNKE